MTDFTISPSTLRTYRQKYPRWRGCFHNVLDVGRKEGRGIGERGIPLLRRATLSFYLCFPHLAFPNTPLRTVSQLPALAGMLFHRKTFLDIGKKGRGIGEGMKPPFWRRGSSSPTRPHPLHLLKLLEAGARPGHDARRTARRILYKMTDSGREKRHERVWPR